MKTLLLPALMLAAMTAAHAAPPTALHDAALAAAQHGTEGAAVHAAAASSFGKPTPPALPLTPFAGATFNFSDHYQGIGTGSGTLGVTNITLSNFFDTPAQMEIFSAYTVNGSCTAPNQGGNNPPVFVIVGGSQTVVLPFPTPWTFTPAAGNCLIVTNLNGIPDGYVSVHVTGFAQ